MRQIVLLMVLSLNMALCIAKEETFDAMILPSIADKQLDFWFKTPPNTGPHIPTVKKVYPNQVFMILMICRAMPMDSQSQLDIKYDFKVIGPDGSVAVEQKDISFYAGPTVNRLIMPNDHVSVMAFDKTDKVGTYHVQMTFHENVSKRTFKTSADIELVDYQRPESFSSDEELAEWMEIYYKKPDPIRSFSGILYVLELSTEWIKENGQSFSFYRRIFQDNPFLWEYYAELYKTVSDLDKRKLLLIAAIVPSTKEKKAFIKNVKGELRKFYNDASKIKIPDTNSEITTAVQLDILWAEFMASGTYEPIKKIISALQFKKYESLVEKVKNKEIKKIDDKTEEQLFLGIVADAAEWSLISNCTQHHQVHQYCQTVYMHEPLSKEVKEALAFVLAVVDRKKEENSNKEVLIPEGETVEIVKDGNKIARLYEDGDAQVLLLKLSGQEPHEFGDCEDTIKSKYESPNKELLFIVYERNCGASTDYATRVDLISSIDDMGNSDSNTVFVMKGSQPIVVKWKTNQKAIIQFSENDLKNIFKQDTVVNGIEIDFKQVKKVSKKTEYVEFSNFNFGSTGVAAGINEEILLRMAGWCQMKSGLSRKEWGCWYGKPPYGDDPKEHDLIKQGIQYYHDNKDKISSKQ